LKPDIQQIVKLPSLQAAPLLLGCYLTRMTPDGPIKVKIVETEAYHQDDPASHSFRGLTPRTAPMFQAGGHLYVYFTYGMHYCFNIVTGPEGVGEGVLIRAAEPINGVKIMQNNRGMRDIKNLTNGPGKLAQAMGISDTSLSGKLLNPDKKLLNKLSNSYGASKYADIWLEEGEEVKRQAIIAGPRIGIRRAAANPWRFYVKGNPFVSRLS
jgi:DNA-3-methyladenine glycosylase